MYFSGNDVEIIVDHVLTLDAPIFQFQLSRAKLPIYGYKSTRFDAIANGEELIQGQFVLNFKQSAELFYFKTGKVLGRPYAKPQDIVDLHFNRIDIYYNNTQASLKAAYDTTSREPKKLNYTLLDVHIQTVGQSISTGGEPIGESYSFLARGMSHSKELRPEVKRSSLDDEDITSDLTLDPLNPDYQYPLSDPGRPTVKRQSLTEDEDMTDDLVLGELSIPTNEPWIKPLPSLPSVTINYKIISMPISYAHEDLSSQGAAWYTWYPYYGYEKPHFIAALANEATLGNVVFTVAPQLPTWSSGYSDLSVSEKSLTIQLPNISDWTIVTASQIGHNRLATHPNSSHFAIHPDVGLVTTLEGGTFNKSFLEYSYKKQILDALEPNNCISLIVLKDADYDSYSYTKQTSSVDGKERLKWVFDTTNDCIGFSNQASNIIYGNGKSFYMGANEPNALLVDTDIQNFLKSNTVGWSGPDWVPPDSNSPYNDNSG